MDQKYGDQNCKRKSNQWKNLFHDLSTDKHYKTDSNEYSECHNFPAISDAATAVKI